MSENEIVRFLHCKKCLEEMPVGASPKEFQDIQVGLTQTGVMVWCKRHDIEVTHIKFNEEIEIPPCAHCH